ncbi:MAG: FkbM family methyltransferase [Synergistaceae bacterium]|nr:FkbM family methyltransferase [Synergistaceae bacterium]
MGGIVYAFEPSKENFKYLEQTAKLNGYIVPIQKGISDKTSVASLNLNPDNNSGASLRNYFETTSKEQVETISIDDFVREHNLPRVDFIKADIEGFERHMLAGAQETLKNFAPKLALCTYHLPDDPEVMASLIKKANPRYNIVQKKMKLFASVPK